MKEKHKKRAEPFAEYLYNLPEAPLMSALQYPTHSVGLLAAAGGSHTGPVHHQGDYWRAYLRSAPRLQKWLKSGKAFLPPPAWPCTLDFPEHLSPADFYNSVLPAPGREARKHNPLRLCPGLPELTAWAHGWPCHPQDYPKMQEGATWLMTKPVFVIWAFDLAIEVVPLPFNDHFPLVKRMALREKLERDPLASGPMTINHTLPAWAKSVTTLRSMVPRHSEGVGPSSRWPMDGYTLPCYTDNKEGKG